MDEVLKAEVFCVNTEWRKWIGQLQNITVVNVEDIGFKLMVKCQVIGEIYFCNSQVDYKKTNIHEMLLFFFDNKV